MSPLTIYGESLYELLAFVAHIDEVVRPDGIDDSIDTPWDLAASFMRAPMRSEAALLLDNTNGHRGFTRTTTESRRAGVHECRDESSWIAATAIALGLPVVSQDDDYASIPGVTVIDV